MRYRGMDRAALDAAYNNRAAVADSAAIIARWQEASARFRASHPGRLDLAYGDSPRERLDLFLAAEPNAPTFAFVHGGYWQMNDKEGFAFLAPGVLAQGVNVALIEYTLAPQARMDRIVAEVRRAAAWLAEHLGDFGADPGRLYVGGHSAGGHLTAMAMTLNPVRGGLAISGLYDLEPIRLCYLNDKLGLDPAEAARRRLRHRGTARIMPAAGRVRAALGRGGAARRGAAGRRRRPFHRARHPRRPERDARRRARPAGRRLAVAVGDAHDAGGRAAPPAVLDRGEA